MKKKVAETAVGVVRTIYLRPCATSPTLLEFVAVYEIDGVPSHQLLPVSVGARKNMLADLVASLPGK